jgi:catechol 2,3-dioxygenase-like lactoylglutathione lyase family enzyme
MIFSIGSIPERKWHERAGRVRTVAVYTLYEGLTCGKEGVKMARGFTISRVGHIGIQVTDVDRSITWYRDVLGLTVTGRWPMGENGEMAFMRFTDDHHNIVLFTHPTRVTDENRNAGYNALQHIALEVADRDEWLRALADLKRKGVEIVQGPLIHGPEGGPGAGRNFGGSGSRSFYFEDPDGNRLEIYTDMMKVPEGEQFPRAEYAEVFKK